MGNKIMTKLLFLAALCAGSIFGQCGSLALNPTTGRLDCIGSGGTISVASLSDGATVQTSLLPTFKRDTCSASIGVNALVQANPSVPGQIVAYAGTGAVIGIAMDACVGTGQTRVALLGSQNCVAEGAITALNLMITGTIDLTRCKDSGTTAETSIPTTTPIIGIARAAASNGGTFEVLLTGIRDWGHQSASGTLPEVVTVTSGVTTTETITLNTTLTDPSQAFPVCATSARVGFEVGGWSFNAGLTEMTITFSPSAPATGTCTANLTGGSGGGGGGGGGDFSSNTSTSVDGEFVLFSGTAGKTGKRANLTAPVTKMTSGVASAAVNSDVRGLWTGTCDITTFLRGDGACAAGAGGDTVSAGTGISITGIAPKVISLDSATGRTHLTGNTSLSFGTVATNDCSTLTVTVTGAALGDAVIVAPGFDFTYKLSITGYVSAADTVAVKLCNPTGSGIAVTASQTYYATVLKVF